MAIQHYYGNSKGWKTFLEIYSMQKVGGRRQIHRQLTDQEAYDTWHLSFYLKEILSYKRLLQKQTIGFDDIPRKEKNLFVYLLMLGLKKKSSILELGHSLFELLDGLEVVQAFMSQRKYRKYFLCPTDYHYIGVDISDELCLGSRVLHPQYDVRTAPGVDKLKGRFNLLYDRNVTSYAFTTPAELARFINRSDVAFMDLFVSKKETFFSLRLGKNLTYFALKELVAHLDKPLFHLFGEKAPGPFRGTELSRGKPVVEGFFLCCSELYAKKFMESALNIKEVAEYFREKHIALKPALTLL